MKTDSRWSAYCHGNADFAFVIDRHKNIIACAMLVVEICRFLLTLRGCQTTFMVFSQKVNTIMMCLHAHVQVYNVCHYLGFSIC